MTSLIIRPIERKSAILTPSSIACLSGVSTINLSAGCSHECVYCYTKGYSFYPGNGIVNTYINIQEKLSQELRRKRKLPHRVYFSPSSDVFQPIAEIQQNVAAIFQMLLERGIEVAFLTKGIIPEPVWKIITKYPQQVFAQIGLITTNDSIRQVFEPGAASVSERLNQIKRLIDRGIATTARIDPILSAVSDSAEDFNDICFQFAQNGIKQLSASVLFLRPAISAAFFSHLSHTSMQESLRQKIDRMFELFKSARKLDIHAQNSCVFALPREYRTSVFSRLASAAQRYNIQLRVCSCKNPDISSDSCEISGTKKRQNIQQTFLNIE